MNTSILSRNLAMNHCPLRFGQSFVLLIAALLVASAQPASAALVQNNFNGVIAASNVDLLQTNLNGAPTLTGNWTNDGVTGAASGALTNGTALASAGYQNGSSTFGNPSNNATVTFALETTSNSKGYQITQIDFYHGWRDDGRDGVQFSIEYATVDAPTTFLSYGSTAKYDPPSNNGMQSVTDSLGMIATGVSSIRFTPFNIDNNYGGISEIDVFGAALFVTPEPSTLSILGVGLVGLVARRRRGSRGAKLAANVQRSQTVCLAIIAGLLVTTLAAGTAQATLVGDSSIVATLADGAGDRTNIELDGVLFDAGFYSVRNFSFQNANLVTSGSPRVVGFLAELVSPGNYEVVWVDAGGTSTLNAPADSLVIEGYEMTEGAFTLLSATTLYAGAFHTGGAIVQYANGGLVDHDGTPSEPLIAGQIINGISNPTLGRTYAFEVNVGIFVPEPSTAMLLGLGLIGLATRRRRGKAIVAALACLACMGVAGSASAGTFVLNPFANGFDASSGISVTKNYTHLVDVGTDDGGATINGVNFLNTGSYTLTGPGSTFNNYNSPADNASGLEDLMDDFVYGGNPTTLTLSGLGSKNRYQLRLYVGGFGGNLQNFSFDDTTPLTLANSVPRNAGTDAVPASFDYTFSLSGTDTDLTVIITPQSPGDTFHLYGFSNELLQVVPEPSTALLLGLGLVGLATRRRRGKSAARVSQLAILAATLVAIGAQSGSSASAGIISYIAISNDANSGISSDNDYSHAIDFGAAGAATINGVVFANGTTGGAFPAGGSGTVQTGSTTLPDGHVGNGSHNVTGSLATLLTDMVYNNTTGSVTLTGLTPGNNYDFRLYNREWSGTGNRVQSFSFDVGDDGFIEDTIASLDEDNATLTPPGFGAENQAYALSYIFRADFTGILSVDINTLSGGSYHMYGLTNQDLGVPVPEPSSVALLGLGVLGLCVCRRRRAASAVAVLICFACVGLAGSAQAVTVVNGSFEADNFTVFPGYVAGNGPVTGWTASGGLGLNPAGGSPFADNGAVPNGSNVAFIQQSDGAATFSQTLTGLSAGETYTLSYRYNGRGPGASTNPRIRVAVDGNTLQENQYNVVGGSNQYYLGARTFTATGSTATISFSNTRGTGDSAVTLDDVQVELTRHSRGWTVNNWTGDADSGIRSDRNYTHALNWNGASTTVNGVSFTGTSGANPSGGNFSWSGLANATADPGNTITGDSAALAASFNFGTNEVTESLTISGLVVGKLYEANFYGVGWDAQPGNRMSHWTVDGETVTFNENENGNNNGIRLSYVYQATSPTMQFDIFEIANATWHQYAFTNNEFVAIPEPSTALMLGMGLVGLCVRRRRGATPVKTGAVCLAIACLASFCQRAEAIIIYSDDFSGIATPLFGTTPDVSKTGATWGGSPNNFNANGAVTGSGSDGVWLPFNPSGGAVYKLSGDINTTGGGTDWITIGFAQNDADTHFNDAAANGYGTILIRQNRGTGQAQAFAGALTGGGAIGVDAPVGVVSIDIEFNALSYDPTNWTMEWFVNGASVAGPALVGTGSYDNIGFVGFSRLGGGSGTIGNFLLVSSIPEPSTLMLAGLGLCCLASRRRRK